MPRIWFWAHASMLGRLRAEDARRQVDIAVATNGRSLKDADQRAYIAALDGELDGVGRPSAPRLSMDQMRRGGMRVVREPGKAASPVSRFKPGERPGLRKEVSAQ